MLSVEVSNRPQLAREFVAHVGATFPILNDDQDLASKVYGVTGTPTNIMIDAKGRIFFRSMGFAPGYEKKHAAAVEYLLDRGTRLSAARS